MKRLLFLTALCTCVLAVGSSIASAQTFPSGCTFVQADVTNTVPVVTGTDWWSSSDDADNKWGYVELEWADATIVQQFISQGSTLENCPVIKTSLGLSSSTIYRVCVVFCAAGGKKIQAGTDPATLATYDSSSPGAMVVDAGTNSVAVPVADVTGNATIYINDGDGAFASGTSYVGLCYQVLAPGGFGTFVQASPDNTVAADGSPDWYNYTPADDNKWDYSICASMASLMNFHSVGSWHENCPLIKTTVSGLDPAKEYIVHVFYDSVYHGSNCKVQAGFSDSAMTTFTTIPPGSDPAHPVSGTGFGGILAGRIGVFTGSDTLSLYVNDGDYAFGEGSRYIGLAYAEDTTPKVGYSDEITVNGNLDDWSDAAWRPFDKTYDGNPIDIADGSAWAAKWGVGGTKVYIAAKILDTAHSFTNSYTGWNSRDAVEFYLNTTGTDAGPYNNTNDYSHYQEQAQQWSLGIKSSSHNTLWATCGYPPAYGEYVPAANELVAAGREDGQWLYYEAAITPYEYFGSRWNMEHPTELRQSIVSPLHAGDIIRTDVAVAGHNGSAYTGMKTSGHNEPGWSAFYNLLAQNKLVRNGVKGTITLVNFGSSTLGAAATVVITDSANVSEMHHVVLDGAGTYTFKTALSGACTAVASAYDYLPQSQPVVVVDGNGDASFVLTREVAVVDAKKQPIGSVATVGGCITAVFDGSFYVETVDRVSGIRVDKANHGFVATDIGKSVIVTGNVEKDPATQEIYIAATYISSSASSVWSFPGTFVQATTSNTVAAYGGDWYSPTYVFNDHKWSPLTIGGDLGAFYSQGSWTENTPKLKTTVNGLNASSTYAVYVVYDKVYLGSNCNIVAGLDPSSMIWFWNYLTPAGQIRADGGYAVFSAPLGSVTGVSSLSVYIDDGDYNFGEGTRYIGLVYANLIQPLGLTNKAAGGGSLIDPITGDGQVGVVGATGLNNIGLLVRTTGRASAGDAEGFTLTDGSGVTLKVSLANAGTTYDGRYIVVTGISSIDAEGVRLIKTRSANDVQIVN